MFDRRTNRARPVRVVFVHRVPSADGTYLAFRTCRGPLSKRTVAAAVRSSRGTDDNFCSAYGHELIRQLFRGDRRTKNKRHGTRRSRRPVSPANNNNNNNNVKETFVSVIACVCRLTRARVYTRTHLCTHYSAPRL